VKDKLNPHVWPCDFTLCLYFTILGRVFQISADKPDPTPRGYGGATDIAALSPWGGTGGRTNNFKKLGIKERTLVYYGI
jgi:hypothetical protein